MVAYACITALGGGIGRGIMNSRLESISKATGEMAQLVRCLLCKVEHLSLVSRTHVKSWM